jgi:hypothetical protein
VGRYCRGSVGIVLVNIVLCNRGADCEGERKRRGQVMGLTFL